MSDPDSSIEPATPRKRARAERSKDSQENAGTMIALFGMLIIGGGLLGLMALVLPQFLGVIAVIGAFFIVPAVFHYLVWGWWMSQIKEDEEGRGE